MFSLITSKNSECEGIYKRYNTKVLNIKYKLESGVLLSIQNGYIGDCINSLRLYEQFRTLDNAKNYKMQDHFMRLETKL